MIAFVEGAERQKTPNEIALNILLAGLTIIFLLAVITLQPFAIYSDRRDGVCARLAARLLDSDDDWRLLSAIGIPAWIAWCSTTYSPCPGARSKRGET